MDILNSLLQQDGLVGLDACKTALERLQRSFQRFDITIFYLPKNNDLYTSIADQVRPAKTIPTRLRAMFATPMSQANLDAERIDLARETVEFPEPMYHALAERSPDYIIPGLAGIPSDRVTILVPNEAFIEAYLLGLNHEMAREFLWREFPVNLDGTFFRQFWDVRDNPKAAEEPASFKDITPVSGWGTTELGSPEHRPDGIAGDVLVVVMRSELLRKYPYTEVFMQKAVWTKEPNTQRAIRGIKPTSPRLNTPSNLFSRLASRRTSSSWVSILFCRRRSVAQYRSRRQPGLVFCVERTPRRCALRPGPRREPHGPVLARTRRSA